MGEDNVWHPNSPESNFLMLSYESVQHHLRGRSSSSSSPADSSLFDGTIRMELSSPCILTSENRQIMYHGIDRSEKQGERYMNWRGIKLGCHKGPIVIVRRPNRIENGDTVLCNEGCQPIEQ